MGRLNNVQEYQVGVQRVASEPPRVPGYYVFDLILRAIFHPIPTADAEFVSRSPGYVPRWVSRCN
jgi:hypothetical protein